MPWKITKDHLDVDGVPSREGGRSPDWKPEHAEGAVPFKLYDDDDELYYEGLITRKQLDGPEWKAFAPLDWARNDAGCTRMDYLDPKTRTWRTL